jgi:transcriptional regulator with PAS, ATPase and Fis domain
MADDGAAGPTAARPSVDCALRALSLFEAMSEGSVAVDREARITWINDKYRALLGVPDDGAVIGAPIERIIPESRLREVVESGRPQLLDLMRYGDQHFVVCRLPLRDEAGAVIGAVGYVFYDRLDYVQPILAKFAALRARLEKARGELAKARRARYSLSSFIGVSAPIRDLIAKARRIAGREGPVMILGETGVGKELLAQGIHQASPRAPGPFVAVNVAAVPETLMEAEFFGVSPGAFTGAERRPRPGKFEIAAGGTLFLDEIGDMPAAIQAKFLRVLQEGEIEALGSNEVRRVNVRVIAATSVDLEARVRDGAFRADLYYRLAVLPLRVPPLRARPDDIGPLAERILDEIPTEPGRGAWWLTDEALALLRAHDWPGNVRELGNVLERATIEAGSAAIDAGALRSALPPGAAAASGAPRTLAAAVAEAERAAIGAALEAAGGDKTEAARLLGLSRSSLYARLKALGE